MREPVKASTKLNRSWRQVAADSYVGSDGAHQYHVERIGTGGARCWRVLVDGAPLRHEKRATERRFASFDQACGAAEHEAGRLDGRQQSLPFAEGKS